MGFPEECHTVVFQQIVELDIQIDNLLLLTITFNSRITQVYACNMKTTPEHLSKMGKKEIPSHQYSHINYILWLLNQSYLNNLIHKTLYNIESHIEYVNMYI